MFGRNNTTTSMINDPEILSIFHLTQNDLENYNNIKPKRHCGWHDPEGAATSDVTYTCETCQKEKLPRRAK
jgi:hypothetical protein